MQNVPAGAGPNPFAAMPAPGGSPVAATPLIPGAAPLPPGGAANDTGVIKLTQTLEGVDASGGGPPLVTGFWPAKVTKLEPGQSSNGNQSITFHLLFVQWPGLPDNPNAGKPGRHTVYVTPAAMWKVKSSAIAIGQGDALTELNGNAAKNTMVMVDVQTSEYTSKTTGQSVKGTRCESIFPWPDEGGGPGTKAPN